MKYRAARHALLAATALAASATAASAQGRPNVGYDASKATFELASGSQLRAGDRLTDRLMYSVWQRVTVKGAGNCTASACPVQFNGETVYARLPQLTIANGPAPTQPTTPPTAGGPSLADGPKRRYERGDQGDAVRRIQEALNRAGAQLVVDSNYGRGTVAAVQDFQRRNGMKVDGITGRETMRRLGV